MCRNRGNKLYSPTILPVSKARTDTPEVAARADAVLRILNAREMPGDSIEGYPVYLNDVIRRTGWSSYYPLALLYKVPEGTWCLIVLSLFAAAATIRSRSSAAQELALWTVPVVILFSMTFLTDINIGVRYVISIFPYVFIAAGKVVPWIRGWRGLLSE